MIEEEIIYEGYNPIGKSCALKEISERIKNIEENSSINGLRILRINGKDKYQIYLKENKEEDK